MQYMSKVKPKMRFCHPFMPTSTHYFEPQEAIVLKTPSRQWKVSKNKLFSAFFMPCFKRGSFMVNLRWEVSSTSMAKKKFLQLKMPTFNSDLLKNFHWDLNTVDKVWISPLHLFLATWNPTTQYSWLAYQKEFQIPFFSWIFLLRWS